MDQYLNQVAVIYDQTAGFISIYILNIIISISMSFKQKYIHEKGPFPFDFQTQRKLNFEKIINLLGKFERNKWTTMGFNFGSMLQTYKCVYGLTSHELQTLLTLLTNIFYEQNQSSVEPRLIILKVLNRLIQYQIEVTSNFCISNQKLMNILVSRIKNGTKDPLKHQDGYMEQLSKFILQFSKYGQEYSKQALKMAIQKKSSKILVCFILSTKNQATAEAILEELLKDCSLWQRDCSWFFVVSQLAKKFPKIDYSPYYNTVFQQIIKTFTTIIDPISQQELKKVVENDPCIGNRSILKSIACILSSFLLPKRFPQSQYVWNSVERIFNIITTSLDHSNEPVFIGEYLLFMKTFIRYFLSRYRKERKMHLLKNQDFIEDFHGQLTEDERKQLFIDQWLMNNFNGLWAQIIPKVLFFEDSDSLSARILTDLGMYNPNVFLPIIMTSLKALLTREDLNMISLYSTKMSILFLQEFIFKEQQQYIVPLLQCYQTLLEIVERLGVAQNLDILELIFRGFLHMNDDHIAMNRVENIIQTSIDIIMNNLEAMSINLEDSQIQTTQLYIDLSNLYFPFFIRLDQKTLKKFADRFMFKMLNQIPESRQVYEYISIILGFIDPTFTTKLFDEIYKKLIIIQQPSKKSPNKKKSHKKGDKSGTSEFFFDNIPEVLALKNQSHVRWYVTTIQCLYQYHPKNIVKDFPRIEKIIIALYKEWDNSLFTELGLDTMFNLIIGLCHVHFDWVQLVKKQNNDYRTMDIKWDTGSDQSMKLITYIYDKYFLKLIDFMKNRYDKKIDHILEDHVVKATLNKKQYELSSKDLRLFDSLLIPDATHKNQDIEEKKLIYKVLSLQYTVLSSIMVRGSYWKDMYSMGKGAFLQSPQFKNIRIISNQYLNWLCPLMQHFNILWEPNNIKVFNFFWRETLDQVYFTSALNATIEKLAPFYYPQLYRKKQLMRNSFLIMNESYALFTSRMQLQLEINPVAYYNNPEYMKMTYILGMNPNFDCTLHSIVPTQIDVHRKYHVQIVKLCKFHICPQNPDSYSFKYIHATQKRQKQRYLMGLKMILTNIKKIQNPFNNQCCIKDQFVRETILDTIGLFKTFEQKIDKMIIIDLFYLMIVFGFDCNLISHKHHVKLSDLFNRQQSEKGLCWLKQYLDIDVKQAKNGMAIQQQVRTVSNKKFQSFRTPLIVSQRMNDSIVQFITQLIQMLNASNKNGKAIILDKDAILHCLLMIMFSKFISIDHPIFSQIITTLINLTKSQIVELFDVSKTGLFHIINRFNSVKKKSYQIVNKPVKRSMEQFCILRYLGGQPKDSNDLDYYINVVVDKQQNYFYPSETLTAHEYGCLGDSPQSESHKNQMTLLNFLNDHDKLKAFIVACSHDKDLKQIDYQVDQSMFEDGYQGITSNGHKLLNYVLDSNPKKNQIFANFIENFSLYPLNFYPRLIKKTIRMGDQKTIFNLKAIAKQLRQSNQIEEVKLSLYISCEMMVALDIEKDPFCSQFIEYLATCPNDVFQFSNTCIFLMFMKNFVVSKKIYNKIILRFRQQKGSSRLRHLTMTNLYILAQGRFARDVAKQVIQYLLNDGIDEGSDQVSEVIVTMIVSCFIIAINMKQSAEWIEQSLFSLIRQKKIYKISEYVGYQIDESLKKILARIMEKTKTEKNMESKNLKTYSKIANRILGSISVYRYNDSFFAVLRDMIFYVVQKVPEQGQTDEDIIIQLKDSEYPENIYKDLIQNMRDMNQNVPSVIKKKLKYIESISINFCYSSNKVVLPNILQNNQKVISIDFIVTAANIYRLMTKAETEAEVEYQMKKKQKSLYTLMALLLAAGVRQHPWKQSVLEEILKFKKQKIVKEFISYWWRGKNPQTEEEKALHYLVQGVQNPYSYFA